MPVVFLLILIAAAVGSEPPAINVIYPKPQQVIRVADSTFIFGHISGVRDAGEYCLTINNENVTIHRDGGWLAFLPVSTGEFVFELVLRECEGAEHSRESLVASASLPITIPPPMTALPDSIIEIAGDYRVPPGDRVLASGDWLEIMFRGTPGLRAWFTIPGVVDSMPMAEVSPQAQSFWGESVFGAGAVPESVLVRGIYSGLLRITDEMSAIEEPIIYHLSPENPASLVASILADPYNPAILDHLKRLHPAGSITNESDYCVSINPPEYPFAVRFSDTVQIIRHGRRKGYFSIFQPEGIMALAVGAEAGWYKLRLSETQFAWVDSNSVERQARGIIPPRSYLRSIRTTGTDEKVVIRCPLAGKHPFRIIEDDKRTVRLQLFGVTSDTDWIRYDGSDRLVDIITWAQPEPGLYQLTVKTTEDIWGYDSYYVGNTFHFQLNKPPENVGRLSGKRIVIDPGHSGDPGAIGPTGLTEAEANLGISLTLARILRSSGAEVILTRDDDSHVPLYDRPTIANAVEADLFVSIHNNALPDGVNPFTNNGVSSYYYHPHSIDLARSIQKEMIKATGLPDYGVYHGNLAVNRPTQYPAVLIECAFMMIPEQEAWLKTDRFRRKVGWAIANGIANFLKDFDDD